MTPINRTDTEARSADLIAQNIEVIKKLFPEAVSEGKLDLSLLKGLVGESLLPEEEREEKYGLNWFGKRKARQMALTLSTGTLRPCKEDSVDWEATKNLMIEGDNLEVLKLLQKSYAGQVKLIYIDPPYNINDDRIYPDSYVDPIKNYLEVTGQIENGNTMVTNTDSSGRFHTNWLNMIYPRIKIAKTLLKREGLICVSIDDNELATLKLVLNEVFGEENFEGHIHWRRRHNQPNDPTKMLGLVAEHILCYSKDKAFFKEKGVGKIALTGSFSNPDGDSRGDWASKPWKVGSDQSGSRYIITTPTGKVLDEEWMGDLSTYNTLMADKRIYFPDKGNGSPRKKYFKSERQSEGQCATNWWSHEQFGSNQEANAELETIFGEKNVFSNPKPTRLMDNLIQIANCLKDDIVLDFFAGSGSTAHAVMARNISEGSGLRFILIQLPEVLSIKDGNQKVAAEYCTKIGKPLSIAELTKERLRRTRKILLSNYKGVLGDTGFKVFKLDTSNILPWEPEWDNLEEMVKKSTDHVREGRSELDILYELLLKLGLDLAVPTEEKTINGKQVHSIGAGTLIVCLDKKIGRTDAEPLALGIIEWHKKLSPVGETTCVFLDSAFADDIAKTNLSAILNQHGLQNVRSL